MHAFKEFLRSSKSSINLIKVAPWLRSHSVMIAMMYE